MTRRRWGLALIAAVVLLVAVFAQVRPRVLSGSAQATPVPGPPSIGDCVLDPFPSQSAPPVPDPSTASGTMPVYPAQRIESCSGDRYGEVVAVIAHPRPYVVKGDDATGRYVEDPNIEECTLQLSSYVGLTDQRLSGVWSPLLSIDGGVARPSVRQQAAGQRWVACVVSLQPHNAPRDSLTAPRYGATLRNAVRTGNDRDLFGLCVATVDWSVTALAPGTCGLPHRLEYIGGGFTEEGTTARTELETSCRRFAEQLTGMPDPTAAGGLAVQMHADDGNDVVVTGERIPAHSRLSCGVVALGDRKLAGSLWALGRAPIPWA